MFHDLLEGIKRALSIPGHRGVVIHDARQKELAQAAIPGLAEELKKNESDISLHLTTEYPVGTVLNGDKPEPKEE